ncbi:MAG: pirin family protein [Planctomycetota bacterium]
MLRIRKAADRGHANHGWLDSRHTFSFGGYRDPAHHNFRTLRVMNEDRVQPSQGFGTHPHRDMEIVTYVLSGELEHKDSMGNGQVLRPGELQRMSAGTGILHSEFNPSATNAAHFYQVWLTPAEKSVEPSYEQRAFDAGDRRGRLQLVASPGGEAGSLDINQDARLYLGGLDAAEGAGGTLWHTLAPGRHAWVQVLRGGVSIATPTHAAQPLAAGDGAALTGEPGLTLALEQPAGGSEAEAAEVLLFDLG